MRLLIVPSLYKPNVGGVEIAVENLSQHFVKAGHYVEIVTGRFPRSLAPTALVDGIRVTRLPFMLPSVRGRSVLTFPFRMVQAAWGLKKVLSRAHFDVINLHYLCESSYFVIQAAKRYCIPVVASVHGSDVESIPYISQLQRRVTVAALEASVRIIANSNSLIESVAKLTGENCRKKSVAIGNGVNYGDFNTSYTVGIKLPKMYVLGIGRFVYSKGFDTLLKAFALNSRSRAQIDLVLVGDGVERLTLEGMAQNLGIADRVHFLGQLPNSSLPTVLRSALFLVVASRREAFGIVALEAMASGKAVVAMSVGGLGEVIQHERTGILVDQKTPEALSAAMQRMIEDPLLATRFGEAGRQVVQSHFTWSKVSERYITVLEGARRGHPAVEEPVTGIL